jgi:hypothetical protein
MVPPQAHFCIVRLVDGSHLSRKSLALIENALEQFLAPLAFCPEAFPVKANASGQADLCRDSAVAATSESSPEKAGGGGSSPPLATIWNQYFTEDCPLILRGHFYSLSVSS